MEEACIQRMLVQQRVLRLESLLLLKGNIWDFTLTVDLQLLVVDSMFTVSCNASFEGPGVLGNFPAEGDSCWEPTCWYRRHSLITDLKFLSNSPGTNGSQHSVLRLGRVLLIQSFDRALANVCDLLAVVCSLW